MRAVIRRPSPLRPNDQLTPPIPVTVALSLVFPVGVDSQGPPGIDCLLAGADFHRPAHRFQPRLELNGSETATHGARVQANSTGDLNDTCCLEECSNQLVITCAFLLRQMAGHLSGTDPLSHGGTVEA